LGNFQFILVKEWRLVCNSGFGVYTKLLTDSYKNAILTALDDFTKQNNAILQKHKDGIFAELTKYHEDGAGLKEEVDSVEELIKITINAMADEFWRNDRQTDDPQS
jgi:hypothetical protein